MAQTKQRKDSYEFLAAEVTKAFAAEVRDFAKSRQMSKSEVVRAAVKAYMEQH